MNGKILIVEDEISIQKILEFELVQAGFHVDIAGDGQTGLELAKTNVYDVILLDVMLPKKDGFTVCRELRENKTETHIILLSARDGEFDRVLGLDTGADDYMTKPFSVKEVVSKVKAVIRRQNKTQSRTESTVLKTNVIEFKALKMDLDKFEVTTNDKLLDFTLKEFELLKYLIKHKGRAIHRNALLDDLWGITFYGETRVVDVHIFKLREKLKQYGIIIKTVRGIGYMLEEDNHEKN